MGSRKGIFVTLEGGEGSGKTTQRRRIVDFLESKGHEGRQTREPGGTEAGELIRDILLHRVDSLSPRAELALYLASRAQLVEELVRPSLARGVDVICDRFADSSTAYQGGGRALGIDLVEREVILFAPICGERAAAEPGDSDPSGATPRTQLGHHAPDTALPVVVRDRLARLEPILGAVQGRTVEVAQRAPAGGLKQAMYTEERALLVHENHPAPSG